MLLERIVSSIDMLGASIDQVNAELVALDKVNRQIASVAEVWSGYATKISIALESTSQL